MTIIKAVASAVGALVVVLALAVASNALLDRYLPNMFVAATAASSDQVAPSASACIDAKGEKRNWPWANAPTLWPRCNDDAAPPAPATKEN
jgi:hypothetical protein